MLLVLALAAFVADRSKEVSRPGLALKTIALAAGPILLVFLQPDAGTALVYGSVLAAVLFVSGIRWLYLVLLAAAAPDRRAQRPLVAAGRPG